MYGTDTDFPMREIDGGAGCMMCGLLPNHALQMRHEVNNPSTVPLPPPHPPSRLTPPPSCTLPFYSQHLPSSARPQVKYGVYLGSMCTAVLIG
jgi:hypothetical protein